MLFPIQYNAKHLAYFSSINNQNNNKICHMTYEKRFLFHHWRIMSLHNYPLSPNCDLGAPDWTKFREN
jgi:hypothetical protein